MAVDHCRDSCGVSFPLIRRHRVRSSTSVCSEQSTRVRHRADQVARVVPYLVELHRTTHRRRLVTCRRSGAHTKHVRNELAANQSDAVKAPTARSLPRSCDPAARVHLARCRSRMTSTSFVTTFPNVCSPHLATSPNPRERQREHRRELHHGACPIRPGGAFRGGSFSRTEPLTTTK